MPLTPPPSAPPAAPDAPGEAPSRANPTAFRALADAFVVWLVGFRTSIADLRSWLASYITWAGTNVAELDALQADVSEKSTTATTQAGIATTKAEEASTSAAAAAVSEANTLSYLQAYRATSYGALASDPTEDPNGNPPTVGDEYFNTTNSVLKRFNGATWQASDISTANLASSGGAALIGHDSTTAADLLDQEPRIQNPHSLRDFFKALYAFESTENSTLTIASYGDSVSADVGGVLAMYLSRMISVDGFNMSTFGAADIGGSIGTFTYAGGAAAVVAAAPDGPCPYIPHSTHYNIPDGGSIIFNSGSQAAGFDKAVTYLARQNGGGDALVELIDDALAVVTSTTVSTNNATVDAVKAQFTAQPTDKKYRVRVTATGGPVVVLGVCLMRPRGVNFIAWRFGGVALSVLNASPKVIFDYINNDLAVSLFVAENKEEDPAVSFPVMSTRMSGISASKLLIGTRPSSATESTERATNRLLRAQARANGWAYVDAWHILKDYAEVTRLGWNGDGTHLSLATAHMVASLVLDRIPRGILTYMYHTRNVQSARVQSAEFAVSFWNTNEVSKRRAFAAAVGGGAPNYVRLYNIGRVDFGDPTAGSVPRVVYKTTFPTTDIEVQSSGGGTGRVHAAAFVQNTTGYAGSTINTLTGSLELDGAGTWLRLPRATVAAPPSGSTEGRLVFFTDGRKSGEGAGAGTGVVGYFSNGGYKRMSDDTAVAA